LPLIGSLEAYEGCFADGHHSARRAVKRYLCRLGCSANTRAKAPEAYWVRNPTRHLNHRDHVPSRPSGSPKWHRQVWQRPTSAPSPGGHLVKGDLCPSLSFGDHEIDELIVKWAVGRTRASERFTSFSVRPSTICSRRLTVAVKTCCEATVLHVLAAQAASYSE